MNAQEGLTSELPDFTKFGMEPHVAGQFVDISVGGSEGGSIKGLLLQGPTGRVLSLTISHEDGLDAYEQDQLALLIERCGEGNWMLEGQQRATPSGTYAEMLIVDAIVAGAA